MTGVKRVLLVVVVLALSLSMAGCADLIDGDDGEDIGDDDSDEIDAETIQEQALAAMEDLETVAFEMEQVNEMGFEFTISMNGVIDEPNERLHMTMDMGELLLGQEVEMYLIEETMYFKLDGQWFTMTEEDEILWGFEDEIDQSELFLEKGDLELVNTTTFDGHAVYEVEFEFDNETMADLFEEHDEFDETDLGEFGEMEVTDVNATQYIDTETYHVRWMEMDMTIESGFGTMTSTTTATYEDFNEPVNIELPEEAEHAQEFEEDSDPFF